MSKSLKKSPNLSRNLEILKSRTLFWGVSNPQVRVIASNKKAIGLAFQRAAE